MNKVVEHLEDHEIALAADFLIEEKYDGLEPRIRQHIEECEQCSANLIDLTDALSDLEKRETLPETQTSKKHPTIGIKDWMMAASISLAIGAGILAWQYYLKYQGLYEISHKETDYKTLLDQNRSLKNEKLELEAQNRQYSTSLKEQADSMAKLSGELLTKGEVIASLYAPNSELEEEMSLAMRSGNLDLLSPSKKQYTQHEALNFQWKSNPESLALVIYNNHGMKVQVIPSIGKGFEMSLAKFGLGMYYYELYFENDLVAINRFEIH